LNGSGKMADGDLTRGSSLSITATIMRTFGDQMEKKGLELGQLK